MTAPGAGAKGAGEDEAAFPYTTASWFFLDALDMTGRRRRLAIVAFGDSITDGTASTMNGDDRWPDVLSRRLQALHGNSCGGERRDRRQPDHRPGGIRPRQAVRRRPRARARLDRDVLALSGVSSLIWLEGINDFSKNGNASVEQSWPA